MEGLVNELNIDSIERLKKIAQPFRMIIANNIMQWLYVTGVCHQWTILSKIGCF